MKKSIIVSAKTSGLIREGKVSSFLQIVKDRICFEADDSTRTDLFAYGVLDKNGNYFVDRDETPITADDIKPYCVGQVIYVREPYRTYITDLDTSQYDTTTEYAADNPDPWLYERDGDGFQVFNKDGSERTIGFKLCGKEAARTFLKVADVKIAKVQELTESDYLSLGGWEYKNCPYHKNPKKSYMDIFIAKHGESAWDKNVYVWVVKFQIDNLK